MVQTQNIRVARVEPLVPPARLRAELPATDDDYAVVVRARDAIRAIIAGRDRRLIAVVGPCSIHDPEAALDYARRLAELSRRVADTLLVVMRVYFEKPRTTIGWKGLINDPHLNGSNDMQHGLRIARRLLLEVTRLGLPAGTELLDPIVPQYVTDLLSWTRDRSTHHREPDASRDGERPVDAGRASRTRRTAISPPPSTRWSRPATRTRSSASTPTARRPSCTPRATRTATSSCAAGARPTTTPTACARAKRSCESPACRRA